jgi:nitrite reductase/ring-hydroxylating ferredoxin subunit
MNEQRTLLRIAAVDDIVPGRPCRFEAGGRRLCLVRDGSQVHALDDLCTHGQAWLSDGEFDADEGVLECPLHGGLFDVRSGRACGAPATKGVAAHPVRLVDGDVYVELRDE